jgi:hypothetical protein
VTGKDGKAKLKKLTPVVSYGYGEDGRRHWRAKGNGLNILFGLDLLAARPHARVLIVEGEKAAEIARLLFPSWVVLAWKGGAGNARNIDVSPLAGRDVVLWPDADEDGSGTRAMEKIGKAAIKAGADVRIVALPPGLPDGWDVADDLPDSLDHRHAGKPAGQRRGARPPQPPARLPSGTERTARRRAGPPTPHHRRLVRERGETDPRQERGRRAGRSHHRGGRTERQCAELRPYRPADTGAQGRDQPQGQQGSSRRAWPGAVERKRGPPAADRISRQRQEPGSRRGNSGLGRRHGRVVDRADHRQG